MQKKGWDKFDILTHTLRWTGQEIAWLYSWELHAIKKLLYRRPYRGKTTVYKQETVQAYWDELMDRMPEGREPEVKPELAEFFKTFVERI